MKRALGEIADVIMGQSPEGCHYNTRGVGLPLITGAGQFGDRFPEVIQSSAEGAKVSVEGDILIGVRATIGQLNWADRKYYLGRGVAAIRPDLKLVHPNYLWHVLRSQRPVLEGRATGSTFKQVKRSDLEGLAVPLLSLEEQKRIAAILDGAEALREKRRQATIVAESLIQAAFLDLFGDAVENPHRFAVRPLITLVDPDRPISYGILKPGEDVEGGVPYVRVVDMQNGGILLSGLRRTAHEISEMYRRSLLDANDLLLSIRGHVGRVAVVPAALAAANITQDTARLAITGANHLFVREFLRHPSIQRWMQRHTKGVAVKGINLGDIKQIPVPVPPVDTQRRFASIVKRVDDVIACQHEAVARSVGLASSLQERAFRGEL